MSYWFGDPYTLVLPRAPIDRRNSWKHARLRVKSATAFACRVRYGAHAFAEYATAHMLLP